MNQLLAFRLFKNFDHQATSIGIPGPGEFVIAFLQSTDPLLGCYGPDYRRNSAGSECSERKSENRTRRGKHCSASGEQGGSYSTPGWFDPQRVGGAFD